MLQDLRAIKSEELARVYKRGPPLLNGLDETRRAFSSFHQVVRREEPVEVSRGRFSASPTVG